MSPLGTTVNTIAIAIGQTQRSRRSHGCGWRDWPQIAKPSNEIRISRSSKHQSV